MVSPQGEELLYVDFNLINEGQSFLAFDQLRIEGRTSRRPQQHLAVTDHYLPTINRERGTAGMPNPEIRRVVEMLDENASGIRPAACRLVSSRPGHRPRHRAGTRYRPARHADHLQQLAHRDQRRLRRARHSDRRRQPASPRRRDADRVAEEAEDHAHHHRRHAAGGGDRQRRDPVDHPRDRGRRRDRLCGGICRLHHSRDVDGRTPDRLQHVDRGRRPHRHDRAGRHDLRIS